MKTLFRNAYREGRRAAGLDSSAQATRREHMEERALSYAADKIEKAKTRGSMLVEARKRLAAGMEHLLLGRPYEAHKQNMRQAFVYFSFFLILLTAEYCLLVYTLRPFGMHFEGHALSIGLLIVGTVSFEEYLRAIHTRNAETYNKWKMNLVFMVSAFFVVAMLALSTARSALITSNSSTNPEDQIQTATNFYSKRPLVFVAIALAALGIAVISGLLLNESVSRWQVSSPVIIQARKMRRNENAIAAVLSRIKELENLSRKAVNEYDRGIFKGPLSNISPLLNPFFIILLALGLLLLVSVIARGEELPSSSVIMLLDLSGSTQGADYLEKTEFQKNRQFVEEIIKSLGSGTHIRILGITEKSFEKPLLILDKTLTKEAGYFSEKIAKDKLSIANEWKKQKLEAKANATDLFGALLLTSLSFENESTGKRLIVLSDMRNTVGLDLETPQLISEKTIQEAEKNGLIADLKGIEVWAIGVSTINKSFPYWNSLKLFWTKYFEKAGARLMAFRAERKLECNGNKGEKR